MFVGELRGSKTISALLLRSVPRRRLISIAVVAPASTNHSEFPRFEFFAARAGGCMKDEEVATVGQWVWWSEGVSPIAGADLDPDPSVRGVLTPDRAGEAVRFNDFKPEPRPSLMGGARRTSENPHERIVRIDDDGDAGRGRIYEACFGRRPHFEGVSALGERFSGPAPTSFFFGGAAGFEGSRVEPAFEPRFWSPGWGQD
jgi:hypothetical protein